MKLLQSPCALVASLAVNAKAKVCHCGLVTSALLMAFAGEIHAQFLCATNNGGITIIGYSGPGGDVTVPGSIGGLPVLAIGEGAFGGSATVTNLTIPEGLTNIASFAFYQCRSLEAINVNPLNPAYSSVNGILFNNARTELIVCPGGYSGSCVVPVGVTNIDVVAFDYCGALTSVTIPNTATGLGWPMFVGATNLLEINVSAENPRYLSRDGILFGTAAPYWHLLRCPEGRAGNFTVPEIGLMIEPEAFKGCAKLTSITILPQTVISIGNLAFSGCTGLTNVSLGEGVWFIGNYAFANCTNLASITLPRSAERVYLPFPGCRNLTTINVDPASVSFTSVDGVLFDYSQTTLIEFPGARGGYYRVPNGVASVSYGAFADCALLTSISVPGTVTNLEAAAFSGCHSLTNIDISGAITAIGASTFENCSNLCSLTLPETVLNIGEFAFGFCSSLATMSLPTGLQNIERWAFWGSALTNIAIAAGVTNIDAAAFVACEGLQSLNVDTKNAFYASIDGVLFDKSCATLLQCPARKRGPYVIPGSATTIGGSAFGYCSDLAQIIAPGSVATIGDYAFESCTNLTGVYFCGNAPLAGVAPFWDDPYVIVYYLPGAAGWGPQFGGRPTALWLPQVDHNPAAFGLHNNQFGFSINWAAGKSVVVDACTDLANPIWSALSTNTLSPDGTAAFSDPNWTAFSTRFYRVRSAE